MISIERQQFHFWTPKPNGPLTASFEGRGQDSCPSEPGDRKQVPVRQRRVGWDRGAVRAARSERPLLSEAAVDHTEGSGVHRCYCRGVEGCELMPPVFMDQFRLNVLSSPFLADRKSLAGAVFKPAALGEANPAGSEAAIK